MAKTDANPPMPEFSTSYVLQEVDTKWLTSAVKPSTRKSGSRSSETLSYVAVSSVAMNREPATASVNPTNAPRMDSSRLSFSNWRTMRARLARSRQMLKYSCLRSSI